MKRRWLAAAALVLAVAVGLLLVAAPPLRGVVGGQGLVAEGEVRPTAEGAGAGQTPRLGTSDEVSELPEEGTVRAVEPTGIGITSRAERLEAEAEAAAEGRANRQRLLFQNLTELDAAAERAERTGDPTYAAALRRRAEILAQGVRSE